MNTTFSLTIILKRGRKDSPLRSSQPDLVKICVPMKSVSLLRESPQNVLRADKSAVHGSQTA